MSETGPLAGLTVVEMTVHRAARGLVRHHDDPDWSEGAEGHTALGEWRESGAFGGE